MCHLNASVLIKGIPGNTLEFLVLRRDSALDDMAVKAVTNFPAVFDQLDHLHSCYKNVRTVSIQKVSIPSCVIYDPESTYFCRTHVYIHFCLPFVEGWTELRNYDNRGKTFGIGPGNLHFRHSRGIKR